MDYRKERNFIVAYEGGEYRGKWDFLTNQFYGLRGTVVKTRPASFTKATLYQICRLHDCDLPIYSVLYLLSDYGDYWNQHFNERMGQRLEEVISVGLGFYCSYSNIMFLTADNTTLNKECVEYLKDKNRGMYSEDTVREYTVVNQCTGLLQHLDETEKSWAIETLKRLDRPADMPITFATSMIFRGIHEKIHTYQNSWWYADLIKNWYQWLTDMSEKLEVPHNILTLNPILRWRYNKFKEERYDEMIALHNDKPFLYYENDRYIVRPLLTRQDFHTEATAQRNCVESMYMEKVADNKTYIVGIRLKSNPNQPYITCEVRPDGSIWQYLLKENHTVYDEEDKAFKCLYQNHLLEALKNEQKK